MYIYIYICMCVCVCVYIHIYIYIYVDVCIRCLSCMFVVYFVCVSFVRCFLFRSVVLFRVCLFVLFVVIICISCMCLFNKYTSPKASFAGEHWPLMHVGELISSADKYIYIYICIHYM